MKDKKQLIPIIAVIAIGILLGGLILTLDKSSSSGSSEQGQDHDGTLTEGETREDEANESDQYLKGPKGGKLFRADNFALELTIFEDGVPPHFRVYLYENGKALPPPAAQVTVTLSRLGAPAPALGRTRPSRHPSARRVESMAKNSSLVLVLLMRSMSISIASMGRTLFSTRRSR